MKIVSYNRILIENAPTRYYVV